MIGNHSAPKTAILEAGNWRHGPLCQATKHIPPPLRIYKTWSNCNSSTHSSLQLESIVGGWTNPSEKYSSNWIISPSRGEKKIFELPPSRSFLTFKHFSLPPSCPLAALLLLRHGTTAVCIVFPTYFHGQPAVSRVGWKWCRMHQNEDGGFHWISISKTTPLLKKNEKKTTKNDDWHHETI